MEKAKEKKKKSKAGRPKAKWKSKANAERIFEKMRNGNSLREICAAQGLPLTKVCEWLNGEEYREQYADAQEARADKMFDDILEIADSAKPDKNAVAAARLQIDTRKWIMGRMCPKKYGDKVGVDISGEVKETHTHDGRIDIAPDSNAIQGLNAILKSVIRSGKTDNVSDTGEE